MGGRRIRLDAELTVKESQCLDAIHQDKKAGFGRKVEKFSGECVWFGV